jgi:hypothetical protein
MAAHDNVHPEQFQQLKLFMGGQEFQDASKSSIDNPLAWKGHGPEWDQLWARKLAESKVPDPGPQKPGDPVLHGAGIHDSLSNEGYQAGKATMEHPTLILSKGGGVMQGEGHHRVAAAADIERTTGRNVWLPVNYQQGFQPPTKPRPGHMGDEDLM